MFISATSAYSQEVTIDRNNIDFAYLQSSSTQYVGLKGTLKNSDAKVYLQEIQVTKEVYDQLQANTKARADYIEAHKTEAETDEFINKVAEYDATEKSLVPDFVDSNWKQLELTDSTETENKYAANASGKNAYFVSWVKVTLGNTDYYYYYASCIEDTPEVPVYVCKIVSGKYYDKSGNEVTKAKYEEECVKKICRIENGKYYDKNGKEVTKDEYYKACPNPKTGRNTYYTYGILTVVGAFILYMFTRRIKKFSR